MELSGASTSSVAGASTELRAAKLAKDQQEEQGKQALQLLDSTADVSKPSSANPAVGGNVDTFA